MRIYPDKKRNVYYFVPEEGQGVVIPEALKGVPGRQFDSQWIYDESKKYEEGSPKYSKPYLNLTGLDFSGQTLAHIEFHQGCDLSDCNFSGATLRNVEFSLCKMERCCFDGAVLENVRFAPEGGSKGCSFKGVDLSNGVSFTWFNFDGVDLSTCKLNKNWLECCSFRGANISNL